MADEAERVCRICLEADSADALCAPCACRGTQAFVHPHCLRTWQRTLGTDHRRQICPVCRTAYRAEFVDSPAASPLRAARPPEGDDPGAVQRTGAWLLVLAASILGGLGLWGLPVGDGSQLPREVLFLFLAVAGGCAGVLGLQRLFETLLGLFGVRLAFVVDDHGSPLLRIVRVGSHIQGLAAGALCVAARGRR